MQHSSTIDKIMPDLVKAQAEMGSAKKGATNPYFKSKYADLGSVIEVCKEILNTNNIVYLQPIIGDSVQTVLIHSSGEWISDEGTKIICKNENDPQSQGSSITYARRYGLQSFLGIPAEDDDGEKAVNRKEPAQDFPKKINTPDDVEEVINTKYCDIHDVHMAKQWSEKKQKHYFAHKDEYGKVCFGRDS